MFERLRKKWFGTDFIMFKWGSGMVIGKVETWPNGVKTVKVQDGYRRLCEDSLMLEGEGKYYKLT